MCCCSLSRFCPYSATLLLCRKQPFQARRKCLVRIIPTLSGAQLPSVCLLRLGPTTIQLFDASGRLVRTLVQGEYARGRHQLTFERSSMTPGVYFYRLTNSSEQATRQMLVAQ